MTYQVRSAHGEHVSDLGPDHHDFCLLVLFGLSKCQASSWEHCCQSKLSSDAGLLSDSAYDRLVSEVHRKVLQVASATVDRIACPFFVRI